MIRRSIRSALVLALLLVCGICQAEKAEEVRFDQHYQEGLRRYREGEYEAALREFQSAYAIRQRPRLLFNMGQAHRMLGHYREALRDYQLYQELDPNPGPGLKAELEFYIEQLKEYLRGAEDTKGKAAQRRLPLVPAASAPEPVPRRSGIHRRWWFWTALGGAVATAVVVSAAVGGSRAQARTCGGDIRCVGF